MDTIISSPRLTEKARFLYLALLGMSGLSIAVVVGLALLAMIGLLMIVCEGIVAGAGAIGQTWIIADPVTRVLMLGLAVYTVKQVLAKVQSHGK